MVASSTMVAKYPMVAWSRLGSFQRSDTMVADIMVTTSPMLVGSGWDHFREPTQWQPAAQWQPQAQWQLGQDWDHFREPTMVASSKMVATSPMLAGSGWDYFREPKYWWPSSFQVFSLNIQRRQSPLLYSQAHVLVILYKMHNGSRLWDLLRRTTQCQPA